MNIKIIYTTHDFYGICPKNNLIDYNGNLCSGPKSTNCAICCHSSMSDYAIHLFIIGVNGCDYLKRS